MAKAKTIQVTQQDIDKALRRSSARCVVARAVARAYPDAHHVEVDLQTIRMSRGEDREVRPTPWQVQQYVVDFDAGVEIGPFTFRLTDNRKQTIKRRKITTPDAKAAKARNSQRERRARKAKQEGRKPAPADLVNEPVATEQNEGEIAAPPRTFKRGGRSYGMRKLRINQLREEDGTVNEPFKLTEEVES